MKDNELIAALKHLKVETGSLACLGCGYADHCSTHGCAILRAAVDRISGEMKYGAISPPKIIVNKYMWPTCSVCKKKEDPCLIDNCFRKNAPECRFDCKKYHEYKDSMIMSTGNAKFCPACGRPLTEEAWDILDNRIEDVIGVKLEVEDHIVSEGSNE